MKLPGDKRAQVILLVAITLAFLLLIWAFGIRTEQQDLQSRSTQRRQISEALEKARNRIKNAESTQQALHGVHEQMQVLEEGVATGDPYIWIFKILSPFEATAPISILNVGPPEINEVDPSARVPYKSASFLVSGSGFYHDINRFINQLEKKYPLLRIDRLELEPGSAQSASSEEHEKLAFRVVLTALFKPGTVPRGPGFNAPAGRPGN